ncbi:MAG TPA: Ig-like domain-containing protein, partial [Cytophagaceae bacterium]
MKIKNLLLVNFIFCFCCHLYGQHEVNLGSTTVFSSTYIHSSKRLSGSNGEHQIEEIKFSDTLTIRYIVNKVENDESATRVYGVLQSPLKGGIFLVKKGTEIEGDVFIASWNKVLRFETRFSQVYLKEEILEKIICVEKESDKPEIESNAGLHSNGTNLKTSNVDTRKLQSYPGAKAVVYIDFDGGMSGQRWANSYNNGIPFYLPPANMSSENEYTVWQVMSEDFKPFDINITTDSTVFHQYPTNRRQRIIVTRYSSWNSLSTTGIAYVNGFSTGDDPCFSFPSGFSSSNVLSAAAAERLGEVSSHEVGHTLGLSHDGSSTTSYYSGHGNWAPIMGSGYYKTVTQWSKGEYAYANQLQDDLAIITKVDNGFGYKADDHANNYASSTALNITSNGIVNASVNNGVIETNTDIDVFHFTTTGGNISLHFGTALPKPNLDILAKLYNSNNQLITSSDVPNATYADINTSLSEGSYYITIEGVGYGSPLNTGYSKYASLGYYEISGTIPISGTGNQLPTVSITAPGSGATYTAPASFTITATASDPDGSISKVEFYNGTTLLGTDNTSPYSYAWSGVVAGTYTLTAKTYDNSGAVSTSSSVTITVTSGTSSCTAPAWNATTIYLGDAGLGTGKGEVVSYNNREYRAKWWTQNNTPGTNSVWLDLGACSSQNQLPSVSITAPDNGATYTAPAGFTITATASDPDGSISKVEFYNGTTLLGTDNTSPYSYAWSNVSAGTYSLTAKAYDNSGGVQTSSVVSVTVNAKVNQLPSVSITAPDNGATYTAPAGFTITATASDPDGSISKVEFYNG